MEFNLFKVTCPQMIDNRWVFIKVPFTCILPAHNSLESILKELLILGHIPHLRHEIDFSYPDPLVINLETKTPIYCLVSMV